MLGSTGPSSSPDPFRDSFRDPTPMLLEHAQQTREHVDDVEGEAVTTVDLEADVTSVSEASFFTGLEGDIDRGGLFLSTYLPHKIGARVRVALTVAGVLVHVRGVIAWKRPAGEENWPPGIGIAFEKLGAQARAAIEAFCRRRAPLYYELDDASV